MIIYQRNPSIYSQHHSTSSAPQLFFQPIYTTPNALKSSSKTDQSATTTGDQYPADTNTTTEKVAPEHMANSTNLLQETHPALTHRKSPSTAPAHEIEV